jgi:hypothetical protein
VSMRSSSPSSSSSSPSASTSTPEDDSRQEYIAALMAEYAEMFRALTPLDAALDFFEAAIFTRKEAEGVSGVEPKVFAIEMARRMRERQLWHR